MFAIPCDWPRRVAMTAGTVISALGVAVLVAWHFHFTPLMQVLTLAPMYPMTALGFLMGGIALCLVSSGHNQAARVLALAMLIPAVLVALEYLLKADFGIDQLLGRDDISPPTSYPGRQSPVTTLCFLAASLSLLAMSSRTFARRFSGVVGILASAIIAVGAVSVLAYLAHTQAFGWGYFSRIAIHTGIGHALVGAGLLALAWKERPAKEGLPRWVPLGLGLGVAVAVVGIWQALLTHRESMFPLLSGIVLGGGFLLAVLLALAVHQTQEARSRSRELQERKAMLELLFEAAPDGLLVTDHNGRITQANQRIESVFGYTRDELIGEPIERLLPEKLRELHRVHRKAYYSSPTIRAMGKELDLHGRRKDGSEFPLEIHLSPIQMEGDIQVLEVMRDITERKQVQEALRRSEERFRGVFETSPLGLALIRPDYRLAKVNPSLCRMSGYSEEELTGMNPFDVTHPDDRQKSLALADRLFKGEIPSYQLEKRYVKKNGEIIWTDMTATILRDQDGLPLLGLGMVADITERKRSEEALSQSEERFRGVFEQGPIGLTLIGMDYRFVKVNTAFCQMLGYSEAELTTMTPLDIVYRDDLDSTVDRVERLFESEIPIHNIEKRYVKKSGEIIWGCLNAAVIHDYEGRPLYGMGMIEDITERRRAEEELRTLSQRLSQAIRFASMGVWEWDPQANCFVWDDTTFELAGIPKVVPLPYEQWARSVHPDDLPGAAAALLRVVREKTQESIEFRIIRPDGDFRYAYAAGGPVLDQQGEVVRVVGIAVDITERKRVEEELRTLSERLSLATRIASIAVWDWDLHTDLGVWDDASFEMFGMPKVNPVRRADFVRRIHPDDLPKLEASTQRVIRNKTQDSVELRILRPDGSPRYLSVAEGAVLDEHGNVTRIVGIALDITDRKQMEARLEANREQMVASARLSALGMMAGGIAHEINNPLAIIHAMASDLVEMVEEEGSAPPETVMRKSAIIRETAGRIARIVKSLRRISREGSSDKLHPTRLVKILEETLEICRERFRANGVTLRLPDTVPDLSVACREVQIAQALLNLLQNAFDAVVDQQGERWVRLEVEARDDSVVISVTDNGPGIPLELRSRIMEPFFTTKEVGKGTGLGLSLSKTIAEEHGGKLEYGEENGHTRFSLVLPLAKEEAEAA
jgi:PAS domain S-box-containing protein